MKNIVLYIGIATIILTNACKEGRVTGISLDKNKVEILVDEKFTLNATIQPIDAKEQTVYWVSEEIKKVSVDNNGQITGKAASNGTSIRVSTKEGEFEDWCNVKVINKNFKNISNCSYNATGKSFKGVDEPAPDSWDGDLFRVDNDPNFKYYALSNWANSKSWCGTNNDIEGILMFLDYDDEDKFILDKKTDMADHSYASYLFEDKYYLYYAVGYLDQKGNFFEDPISAKYEVTYSLATNTIDLKGKTSNNKTATILLKIVNKLDPNDETLFGDTAISDAIFKLSSPQKYATNEEKNQNTGVVKHKKSMRPTTTVENDERKVIPKEKIVSIKEFLK